jgi:hypothetical protein
MLRDLCYSSFMRILYFILLFLSFFSNQLFSAECDLRCKHELLVKKEKGPIKKMALDHSCCKGQNKENEKENNKGKHLGHCLHDSFSHEQNSVESIKVRPNYPSYSDYALNIPVIGHYDQSISKDYNLVSHQYFRPYLRFKSRLKLHILKDQFLI